VTAPTEGMSLGVNGGGAAAAVPPFEIGNGRNPHGRTSWKLVGNPGHELVAN